MASRLITDLHPQMQPLARQVVIEAHGAGLDLLVYCTYRSRAEQHALFLAGRDPVTLHVIDHLKIVTDADAGESAHNYGLAMDCVCLVGGKPQWDRHAPVWQEYGAVVRACGLVWYGTPGSPFTEFPHAEMPNWRAFINRPTTINV